MFRFFALTWDPTLHGQDLIARRIQTRFDRGAGRWRAVLGADGLRVWCCGEEPLSLRSSELAGGRGVVLGTLFEWPDEQNPDGMPAPARLDEEVSGRILRTHGRELVEHYWGNYVAILQDSGSPGTCWILRGPFSSLPCLYAGAKGVHACFSDLEDWDSLDLAPLSVDWSYVAQHLVKSNFSEATGVREVTEVPAGTCMEWAVGGRKTHAYWDPLTIANTDVLEDPAQATRALRHTTIACIGARASCYESIVHMLSGGLDSSIVLGALSHLPRHPRLACIIRHSAGSDTDERDYARPVAAHAACELLEQPRDPSFAVEDMFSARLTHVPHHYLALIGQERATVARARERGAGAIFSGIWGDQLFYASQAGLPVADYISRHGFGRPLLGVILTASRLQSRSVWSVLGAGARQGMFRRRWDPIAGSRSYNTLLVEEVVRKYQAEDEPHPWYRRDAYVPPGKQFQIFSLLNPGQLYSAYHTAGDPETVAPLMSQPLVELCLRIPTYVLMREGWDRAIARNAFVGLVPERNLKRRSKGGQEEYTGEVMKRNLPFIRDLMLQGGLVSNGLLDRRKLEESLSGRPSTVLRGLARISRYICVEVWLRLLSERRLRAAA